MSVDGQRQARSVQRLSRLLDMISRAALCLRVAARSAAALTALCDGVCVLQGVRKFVPALTGIGFGPSEAKDHPECAVCKTYLYFHAVECPSSSPGRFCCAHHAHAVSAKPAAKWTVHYRFSLRELCELARATAAAVPRPALDVALARWRPPVLFGKEAPPVAIAREFLPDGAREAAAPPSADAAMVAASAAAEAPAAAAAVAAAAEAAPMECDAVEGDAAVVRALVAACVEAAVRGHKGGGDDAMDVCGQTSGAAAVDKIGSDAADDSDASHQTVAKGRGADAAAMATGAVVKAEGGYEGEPVYETRHVADVCRVRAAVAAEEADWHAAVDAALAGGASARALDALLARGARLAWSEADASALADAAARLEAAKRWLKDVSALQQLGDKPSFEAAAPLLERDTHGGGGGGADASPAVTALRDGVARGRAWSERVAAARDDAGALQLAGARALLDEGLALPLHSLEAAKLRDAVAAADAAEAVLAGTAANSGGGAAAAADCAPLREREARELVASLAAARITFPAAQELASALAKHDAWAARARQSVARRAPLDEVRRLAAEASALAFESAETAAVVRRVKATEKFIESAEAALAKAAPLKDMRRMLHAGERMAVEMPQVAALKASIRRREWEESAARALNGKTTVAGAAAMAAEAAAMGVEADAPPLAKLTAAVAAVQEWEVAAGALLARIDAAVSSGGESEAPPPPDEAELQACIAAAAPLRLRSDKHATLSALAARSVRWRAAAAAALQRGGGGAATPLDALEALAAEGAALGVALPEAAELAARIAAVREAGTAAAALLQRPLAAVDLPELEDALAAAGAAGVSAADAAALEARCAALRWEATARAALSSMVAGGAAAAAGSGADTAGNQPSPTAAAERPPLAALVALLPADAEEEAGRDAALLAGVRGAVAHALAWEAQACVALGLDMCAPRWNLAALC